MFFLVILIMTDGVYFLLEVNETNYKIIHRVSVRLFLSSSSSSSLGSPAPS